MLAKLMKYEIKATARIFLPMYAVLLVFAIINRLLNPFHTFETQGTFNLQVLLGALSTVLYFILIIAVFVIALVISIQRFYKNLLGDEGYLMFTLPVKPWQHIISKLLTAVMWYILNGVLVIISGFILISIPEIDFSMIIDTVKTMAMNMNFAAILILILVQLAAGTLMIYDAIALGHLFQKHRLLASFGMYCALYMAQQLLLSILILSFSFSWFQFIIRSTDPTPTQLNKFLIFIIIPGIIMGIVHFIVTNYIMNRKLNLE